MRRKITCIVALILVSSLLSTTHAFSESLDSIPSSIRSPRDLCHWLASEFTYEFKFPDYKQTPSQTLNSRRGDCDDFAAISKIVLARLNIASDVIVINFRKLGISHAVCMFKTGETYSFISNKDLVVTKGRTITEAIDEKFPDWERILVVDADGGYNDVIERRYASIGKRSGVYNLAAPSLYNNILGPQVTDMGLVKLFLQQQLMQLSNSGMPVNVGTFITILKGPQMQDARAIVTKNIEFLFNKIQLTANGFRIACLARDGNITRKYYAVFSLRRDDERGFSVLVYSEKEWERMIANDEAPLRYIEPLPQMNAISNVDKHYAADGLMPRAETISNPPSN